MKNLFVNKKAMTIPELIIVVVLITIVMGAAIMPYIMQQDLLKKQMALSKLQDEVSVALAYIEKDAFRASEAVVSTTTNADDTLTLTITDFTATPFTSSDIEYTLDGSGDITRTVDAGTAATVASNITTLAFDDTIGANYVGIDIVGQDNGQVVAGDMGIALRAVAA